MKRIILCFLLIGSTICFAQSWFESKEERIAKQKKEGMVSVAWGIGLAGAAIACGIGAYGYFNRKKE